MLRRGYPDRPGRASNKEGESWVIIPKPLSESIRQNRVMAIAIADGGRGGEVRYLGEFSATEAAIRKLVAKLSAKYRDLMFCYEAGPTGYGLYRLLKSLGHECLVVAPSLIPRRPATE
jgi:hypothetical protein